MDYTYLEKLILLSLKEKALSEAEDGNYNYNIPVQKLWHIIGEAYSFSTVYSVEGDEIIQEEILDPAESTPTDMKVALRMLLMEELIKLVGGDEYSITAKASAPAATSGSTKSETPDHPQLRTNQNESSGRREHHGLHLP